MIVQEGNKAVISARLTSDMLNILFKTHYTLCEVLKYLGSGAYTGEALSGDR